MGWLDELLGGTTRSAVAGGIGAPVDAAALGLNALIAGGGYAGHKLGLLSEPPRMIENPVGGSEWIAGKMRGMGLLNDAPGSTADNWGNALGSVLVPLTAAKAPQIARGLLQMGENAAIPQTLNRQAGMIKTPFGRIPETYEDRAKLRDLLNKNAVKSGYEVAEDSAYSGASLYSTITDPVTGKEVVVRISDHRPAFKYIPKDTNYFSVSPDLGDVSSGGTFEQAISWMKDKGMPIKNIGPRYEKTIAKANADRLAAIDQAKELDAYRNAKPVVPDGKEYIMYSTKINGGGRRYDVNLLDGRKITAYSKNIPDDVKTGDRDDLVRFIIDRYGSAK